VHTASLDPNWQVVVHSPRALRYREGADVGLDRPEHVRSASSATFLNGKLVVVQDDASFIALVDPRDPSSVTSIPLADDEGVRQFDDVRGNKHRKLDLEASVVVDGVLVAFGSGSTSHRARVLYGDRLIHAQDLFVALRLRADFAGSELNIEGVVRVGDRLRLFNRGNGAPRGDRQPINATCDIEIAAFIAHLNGGPIPALHNVQQYELGEIDGVRLSFTDATNVGDRIIYLAAAEASPDATHDGPVSGVAIGDLETMTYARLATRDGWFAGKAEGIAFDPENPQRGWLVVDHDEPTTAGELWEFEMNRSLAVPA
jgi:hypothetical protein